MFRIQASLARLKRDETGIAPLEYALIAALIAVVLLGAVASYGSSLAATFGGVSSAFGGISSTLDGGPASAGASFCQQQPLPSLSAFPDNSCRLGAAGAAGTAAATGGGPAFAE